MSEPAQLPIVPPGTDPPDGAAIFQTPIGAIVVRRTGDYTKLPDGRTAWFQRRQDDCMRAAVATVLQVPYLAVPDLDTAPGTYAAELDTWARWGDFAATQGCFLRFHSGEPDAADYIALSTPGEDRYRHCRAVMAGHVFDPGSGFDLPPGFERVKTFTAELAVTFTHRKDLA
jgi:hypothetical protein